MTAVTLPSPVVPGLLARRIVARLIDDALLLALTIGTASAFITVLENQAGEVQSLGDSYGMSIDVYDFSHTTTALLAAVATLAAVTYVVWASASSGRSPGRRAAGIAIRLEDGGAAHWSTLLGREFLRFALVLFTISLAGVVAEPVQSLFNRVPVGGNRAELLMESAEWLPFIAVLAVWIGAALADPFGRAPHDRLSGTRVVRQPRARS